ncbi:cytochrome P450 [Nonomuraea diastatica]|uniref:Cytochrome P450 n=1 Tax=Nonomuraea diastatica TaxID=1848329 RepID=A0A4R4X3B3_9ACTN|nr:cytochrome P450 [Nonomuraea diastatica]TDD24748.1 cytochrome P450 [Nonomuraea diastatica]
MNDTPKIPHGLPTDRGECPFDPPAELTRLRKERPISRMVYPDGHEGWLVTSYAAARAILADPRFSSRAELRRFPVPTPYPQDEPKPAAPGTISRLDPPEHTHYRRMLTGKFTVRRLKQLESGIRTITEDHIEAMRRHGPPVDLVQVFALPIPSLVICDLLGVPYADRDRFQRDTKVMFTLDAPRQEVNAAIVSLAGYIGELIRRKRSEPGDDLLSDLIDGGELDDQELTAIGMTLLIAGHETTANMLALGTFALLENPDQVTALRESPALVDQAVEELLRYLSVAHIGPGRAALEDVEIDGHLIRKGEVVTISLPAANRDPRRFDDPDRLDVTRSTGGHLAFSHGIHQCLGQQLSRIELRIALAALLDSFPTLHLGVPAHEIPLRETSLVYGVDRLPVAW